MADPIQYSGVTYDNEYYRKPEESMYDYMKRLAAQRASGILGGGGMLDTPAAEVVDSSASMPLGQVTQNCPAGYTLRNGACVPIGDSGDSTDEDMPKANNEQYYNMMRALYDDPEKAAAARSLIPWGLGHLFLSDDQIEGAVRNMQNEATGDQGFLNYIQGKDGDVIEGNIKPSWWDRTFGDPTDDIPKGYDYNATLERYIPTSGSGSLIGLPSTEDMLRAEFQKSINATPMLSSIFGAPTGPTGPSAVVTAQPTGLPQLPTVVSTGMLSPSATSSIAESVATTGGTDWGYNSDSSYTSYSPSWSASDTSSWDTSGGGTNADGSYDISSWF